jgi:hypothetical protein
MTMMMASFCFHETEASDYIEALECYGFSVLDVVAPNEPNYVFVEATINIGESVPHVERVRSLLKVLGQVDTIDIRRSGTRDELAERLLSLLQQIMPMASVTEAGPVPLGHIPFQMISKVDSTTANPKLAPSEVEEMAEDELFAVNERYDLGINLDFHTTTHRKRGAIIAGLQSAKMLEY